MAQVVVFGSLNVDMIVGVDRLPRGGETILATDWRMSPGGKGANQAMAAARSGAHVRMVGRVGMDSYAKRYRLVLQQQGIDVAGVSADEHTPTGRAMICVDRDGDNMIVVVPGANGRVSPADTDRLGLDSGDVLLTQLEVPLDAVEAALEAAAAAGARTVLNLSPYHPLDRAILDRCDVVIVNQHEAAQMPPSCIDPGRLIVTRGAEGASWGSRNQPAPRVTAVDTTGAGDAFAGTIAGCLALGLGQEETLAKALAVAADAVTHHGAQPWTW